MQSVLCWTQQGILNRRLKAIIIKYDCCLICNAKRETFLMLPRPVMFKMSCLQLPLPCLILELYLTSNASILRWVLDSL